MLRAISRSYVDLSSWEIICLLSQLARPGRARSNRQLEAFEASFARHIGAEYAVSFPTCRSAMYHSLIALGFDQDDEVILPAYTFWVDAAMVVLAGLKPVFVDVDFATHNLDADAVKAAVTLRTRAIFPTHLNGMPADMAPIMDIASQHGLRVIEDCARSCGASYQGKRVGTFDIGNFSFGYGKGFYCFGGGMAVSNDETFIGRLRELKKNFIPQPMKEIVIQTLKGSLLKYLNNIPMLYRFSLYPVVYKFQVEGREQFASRFRVKMPPYDTVPPVFRWNMSALQTWFGFRQLRRADLLNEKRKRNAQVLTEALTGIDEISIPRLNLPDRDYISIHYAVWSEKKQELQRFLTAKGVDVQDETAVDTTTLDRFRSFVTAAPPVAARLHDRVLFLPTHPNLDADDMRAIAGMVRDFFKTAHR